MPTSGIQALTPHLNYHAFCLSLNDKNVNMPPNGVGVGGSSQRSCFGLAWYLYDLKDLRLRERQRKRLQTSSVPLNTDHRTAEEFYHHHHHQIGECFIFFFYRSPHHRLVALQRPRSPAVGSGVARAREDGPRIVS